MVSLGIPRRLRAWRERLWREDGLDDEDIAEMPRDSEAESRSIADVMSRQFDRE